MTSQPSEEHLVRAAASLSLAYKLIDRLGEFFQAEHAWLFEGAVLGSPRPLKVVDERDWVQEVNRRLDYVGFAVPELYETLIHLAHSVEQILVAHTEQA